jgi:methionyl-tRNA formyltransferase
MRLGFAGTPPFAVPALDALTRSRHSLAAVFTQPDRPAGRGQTLHESAVKQRAKALGIPLYQPASIKSPDVQDLLRSLRLDALVVVAYGLILPPGVLGLPALGCFNIHASLLPRWRGAAPIQRALLAGDTTTGITIMRMEAGLDTGPMLATRRMAIVPDDTAATLHDRLAQLGGELIVETLDAVASGAAHEQPQPACGVTYADKINKAEALIDWRDAAASIVRRVHAFNPWPIAETRLDGAQLRIWEAEAVPDAARAAGGAASYAAGGALSQALEGTGARAAGEPNVPPGTVLAASNEGIDVACGDGALRIVRLQLAGRKPLAARDFIKAQRLAGARFASP